MEKAYNPSTGEVMFLVDNQWVKPEQSAENPKTGERAYLVNNQWEIFKPPAAPTPKKEIPPTGDIMGGDFGSAIMSAVDTTPTSIAGTPVNLKGKSVLERVPLSSVPAPTVDAQKNLETMLRSESPESVMFTPGRQLQQAEQQIAGYKNKQQIAAEQAAQAAAARETALQREAEQGYGVTNLAQDIGVGLGLKGAHTAFDTALGLADLATGWIPEDERLNPLQLGNWNKMFQKLDEAGIKYDSNTVNQFLTGLQSPQMQLQLGNVAKETGFLNKLSSLAVNPLALIDSVTSNLPAMLATGAAGGAVLRTWISKAAAEAEAKGLQGAAAQQFINNRIENAAIITAHASEGVATAGQLAEQARQSGVSWEDYVAPALMAGTGTALIGYGAGKVASKLGIGDIETDITARMAGVKGGIGIGDPKGNLLKYVGGEMLKEGVLEELPQSMQEQIWQNVAMGRPWNEGVPEAGAEGLATGAAMGGGHAALSRALQRTGQIVQDGIIKLAQENARKGMPMTPEELARSKGFLRTKKSAEELADDLDAFNQQALEQEDARNQQQAEGAPSVTTPITPTSGAGVRVAGQPSEVAPTAGVGEPVESGMVPTGQDVTGAPAGEAVEPTAVTPTLEERLKAEDEKIKAEDERNAAYEAKKSKVEQIARVNASAAFDQVGDYSNLQDAIDSLRNNMEYALEEGGFKDDPDNLLQLLTAASNAFDDEVEKLKKAKGETTAKTAEETLEPAVQAAPTEVVEAQPAARPAEQVPQQTPLYKYINGVSKQLDNFYDNIVGKPIETLPAQLKSARTVLDGANNFLALLDTQLANWDHPAITGETDIAKRVGRAKANLDDRELLDMKSRVAGVSSRFANQVMALTKGYKGKKAVSQEKIDQTEEQLKQLYQRATQLMEERGLLPTEQGAAPIETGAIQPVVPQTTTPTAAPLQLTQEPFTIDVEARIVNETVGPQVAALPAPELQRLESHYGLRANTQEFLNRVRDDIVRFANEGADAVANAIRDIIKKLHAGVLLAAMIFNPTNISVPEFVVYPKYTTTRTEQIYADLPAGVEQMSEGGKEAYRTLFPVVQQRQNNKFFIIADKPTAHTYIFNPDGTLFLKTKTLFGKSLGDYYKGNNNLPENRVTLAGFFTFGLRDATRSEGERKTAGEYDYGKVFVLDKVLEGKYSATAFHSVWLHESDAAARARALQTESETDARYSFGCINVNKETYGDLVNNHLDEMDGSAVFVVPDDPKNLAELLSGKPVNKDEFQRTTFTPPTKEVVEEADVSHVDPTQAAQIEADRRRTIFESISETAAKTASDISQNISDLVKANMAGVGKIIKLYKEGKLSVEQFADQMLNLQTRIDTAAEAKRNAVYQRQRGYGRVVKAIEDAKKQGRISPDTADFALWFLAKNPAIAANLGIKIAIPESKKAQEEMEATKGFYVPFEELVRIITNIDRDTGKYVDTKFDIAVHEILHHAERMLPPKMQAMIRREWGQQLKAELKRAKKEGDKNKIAYCELVLYANTTHDSVGFTAAKNMLTNGEVPIQLYALFNPSEFWAVRGSGIMAGRYDASSKGRFAKVAQWMREFIDAIKSFFGFRSNHPVIKGLDAVLRGDGTFVSNQMLASGDLTTAVRQIEPKGLHPDVSAAINRNDISGALKALARNTSGLYSVLAERLSELNLPTSISFNNERELVRQAIDYSTREAQAQLFTYIRRAYPEVYEKYFKDYDKPSSLEKVYQGLKELEKAKYDTTPLQLQLKLLREKFDQNMPGLTHPGMFVPFLDSISLNTTGPFGITNRVFLHEVVHAATEYLLRNTRILNPRQLEAVADLYAMFEYAKANLGDMYAFKNIYEFVAEALTNKKFQEQLRKLPYKVVKSSIFNSLVNFVMRMFGIDNVASASIIQANEIFSATRDSNMGSPTLRFATSGNRRPRYKKGPLTSKWRSLEDVHVRVSDAFRSAMTSIPKAGQLGEGMKRLASYKLRQAELPFLGLRMIKEDVGHIIPYIGSAIKLIDSMGADRGRMFSRAKTVVDKWFALQLKKPEQSRLMSLVMLEATIQGIEVDPLGPGYIDPLLAKPTDKVAPAVLVNAWNGLDPEFQQLYRDVRNYYTGLLHNTINEMKQRVRNSGKTPAEIAELIKKIDDNFNPANFVRPYFPLRRFGDFWFQVTANGLSEFYTFENHLERDLAYDKRHGELAAGNAAQQDAANNMKSGNSVSEMFLQNKDATGVLKQIDELIDEIAKSAVPTTVTKGGQTTVVPPASADAVVKEIKQAVDQLVYVLLPQQSMRKMFINRRAIQGASSDMLRVFCETATRAAYQQSRFKYVQPFLNNIANAHDYVSRYVKGKRQTAALDYITEIENRYKNIFGIEDRSPLARFIGSAQQVMYYDVLIAPASALMQVIAFPIMAERTIGGKYGVVKANKVMAKYFAQYMRTVPKRTLSPLTKGNIVQIAFPSIVEGGYLKGVLAQAAQRFIDDGDIAISQPHDVFNLAERPSSLYTGRAARVALAVTEPFHQMDRLTREVTLMSVFELAYDRYLTADKKDARGVIERDPSTGQPLKYTQQEAFDLAISDARDAAAASLGEYLRQLKGRAFANPVGQLVLQFKQVPFTILRAIYRDMWLAYGAPFTKAERDAFKAELEDHYKTAPNAQAVIDQKMEEFIAHQKEIYREAFRKVILINVAAFLMAGAEGTPLYFLASIIPAIAKMFAPDDDDMEDFETWFYNMLMKDFSGAATALYEDAGMDTETAEKLGLKTAHAIARGIPSAVTNWSVTDRIGINPSSMLWRDARFTPDMKESVQQAVIANMGAVPNFVLSTFWDAMALMQEGEWQRAYEKLFPSGAGPSKTWRYATEGVEMKSGKRILHAENLDEWDLAAQFIGITPESVAVAQRESFKMSKQILMLEAQKQKLLSRIWSEHRNGSAGEANARAEFYMFAAKHPNFIPDPEKSIEDSIDLKNESLINAANNLGVDIKENLLFDIAPSSYGARKFIEAQTKKIPPKRD
jgi:hypothetical protein